MNCKEIKALGAQASIDPELVEHIQTHLANCPACMDETSQLPIRLNQPRMIIPPPNFAAKIMAKIPETPQIAAHKEHQKARQRWTLHLALISVLVTFIALGVIGIMVDSSLPARIVGGAGTISGRAALALTLVAKPMIALLSSAGLPIILFITIGSIATRWAWQRLAQPISSLVAIPVEAER